MQSCLLPMQLFRLALGSDPAEAPSVEHHIEKARQEMLFASFPAVVWRPVDFEAVWQLSSEMTAAEVGCMQ